MAAKDVTDLKVDIASRFPNNTTRLISPSNTRNEFNDLVDSNLNKVETANQSVASLTDFVNGVKSDGFVCWNGAHVALNAYSTSDQVPSALDTPLQITYGAAQTTSYITLTSGGRITYDVGGIYHTTTYYRFGRTSSTGSANLIFAYKVNGSWVGSSSCTLLDNASQSDFITLTSFYEFTAGDYVDVYVIRDSSGNNDGGLYSFNPVLSGVPDTPSARVVITKMSTI